MKRTNKIIADEAIAFSDTTKKVWLLRSHVIEVGIYSEEPREIFDLKETCFDKYPGNWRKDKGNSYLLANCAQFEEYKSIDYLTQPSQG